MNSRIAFAADLHGPSRAVAFMALLRAHHLPMPEPEYRFAPPRRWRFDYAWPKTHVALEIEGGVWTNGRHTRGAGFLRDLAKYNEAALRGWLLLRVSPAGLLRPETMASLRRAFALPRSWP